MAIKKILNDLLFEITSKQQWYSKVFNNELVENWKGEFLNQVPEAGDMFDFVIRLARATSQGSFHDQDCQWEDHIPLCNVCKIEKMEEIEADPSSFDLKIEDIPGIFEDKDEWIYELDLKCNHPRCLCIPPDFELDKYIRYTPDGVLPLELRDQLRVQINFMLDHEFIDWHPGSNEQVRDLIHPSMYCYVKGVSRLSDNSLEPECEEDKRYQWLPSEFKIHDKVQIKSYINNLDDEKYPGMITLLEQSFEAFLPSLEAVLKTSLKGKNLQVITKIATIYLDTSKPVYPGGSWHIEGMPYEHIAATCIHYLDVKGISESFLEFRKPVLLNDEDPELIYPQSDDLFTTHHYGIEKDSHFDGQMNRYLGLIKCQEGASVVFPNTLQHKVKEFGLIGGNQGIRTILVFFVIDPSKRIISTADVPFQREIISREDAERHRERLMFHRKFFVATLNKKIFERPYSLCEH